MRKTFSFLALWLGCITTTAFAQPLKPQTYGLEKSLLTYDQQNLGYREYGKGGYTLLFVHGWMCDQNYWNRQVDAFANDFRVITLDLPGHGASGQTRKNWTIDNFSKDITTLIRKLGLNRVILVGHSMGGPVVINAAPQIKERIAAIIGVDTMKQPKTKIAQAQIEKMITPMRQNFAAMAEQNIRQNYFHKNTNKDLVNWVVKGMASGSPYIATELVRSHYAFDRVSTLKAITGIPLTFINSDYRAIDTASITTLHENARIVTLSGVKHFLMLEAPNNFNAILRTEILRLIGSIHIMP